MNDSIDYIYDTIISFVNEELNELISRSDDFRENLEKSLFFDGCIKRLEEIRTLLIRFKNADSATLRFIALEYCDKMLDTLQRDIENSII